MSDFEPSRFVVVDDTDPRIKYEGSGWKLNTAGTTDAWGIFGPTYNHTLTETFVDGSLSFRFNGTKIYLYGTIDTVNNQPRPSWICTIDGKGTGRQDAKADQHTNHWVLCDEDVDGLQEHLIMFNVTVPSGAVFRFDEILYAPPEDVVQGEALFIQDTDSMITYRPGPNWNQTDGITYDTDIPGSYLTFNFTGTSATFYSCLRPNLAGSTAEYAVDGGPPTSFVIPSHTDANRLFNQPLFAVTDLTPTAHTLVVNYTGQRNHTPLSLDFFIINLPPAPSGSGSSPSPSPSKGPAENKASTPVGAIAGGVVGGVVGLFVLGLIIFFIIRRRREQSRSPENDVTPFTVQRESKPETVQLLGPGALPTSSDIESSYDPYSSSGTSGAITKQQQALAAYNDQPRDVRHTDSGIRLGDSSGSGAVRDIPPEYSED